MKRLIYIALFVFVGVSIQAQSFGVRAGLNFPTFNGPLENASEKHGFGTGFHFGINYGLDVSDMFSVIFEVGYSQNGMKYTYNGDSYFIIRNEDKTIWEKGSRDMDLRISTGYISLPVVANYKFSRKFEVYGGVYGNILVSPTARGSVTFVSTDNPDRIKFIQSLDYKYNSDKALGTQFTRARRIGVYDSEGKEVYFGKIAGAYFQHAEKRANSINMFDAGFIGGANYFLNRGFYIGARLEYGLLDLTDNRMDVNMADLTEDNQFVYRNDRDTHLGINVSMGFRF